MAVERLTPERRRQLTREALVAAAAEVFTAKGFHAASLDEIADAAGFTRGAIYSNFGSKEELLYAVIDHVNEIGLAGVADTLDSSGDDDPVRAAAARADTWGRLVHRSPELIALSLELRLYALRNPQARERIAELDRQTSDKLTAFIEDEYARRGAPLHMPARDLADLGRAAVDGLEQMAAVDETAAKHYQQLVTTLFVLLTRATADAPPETSHRGRGK